MRDWQILVPYFFTKNFALFFCKKFAKNAQKFCKKRKELEFANLSFNSLLQIIYRYSKIDSNLTSAIWLSGRASRSDSKDCEFKSQQKQNILFFPNQIVHCKCENLQHTRSKAFCRHSISQILTSHLRRTWLSDGLKLRYCDFC